MDYIVSIRDKWTAKFLGNLRGTHSKEQANSFTTGYAKFFALSSDIGIVRLSIT